MRITTVRYICDECRKEETDPSEMLNWIVVGIIRDGEEFYSLTTGLPGGTINIPRRGVEFCSIACLIAWAASRVDGED